MALILYRRHRKECEAGYAEDVRSGEFDETRRGWKRCGCLIHVSGTIGGKFKRKQTGKAKWDEAKAVAAEWEQAGSWDGRVERKTCVPTIQASSDATSMADPQADSITVKRAIQAFTSEFSEYATPNTQKKYKLLLGKLSAFSKCKGYILLDQWGPTDVREFRSSWSVSPQTAAKNMSTVKAFFEFCLSNEWISRNPARLVRTQRGRDTGDRRSEQKLPFSDQELRKMYDACETTYGKQAIRWSRTIHHQRTFGEYVRYNFKWTGRDLADFISVSVYTGLRISDVSTFHIDRMQPTGEIHVRTTKAGTHVYTWVPEWLQERIRARAQEVGSYIFGEHKTADMNVVTDVWRRKLIKLWSLCGQFKEKPTPHRFRHTFARILLQRPGVTVRDVAELLGNSEQMVRKHYAAWIPERQERLTAVLKAAFNEKPRPNVIEIPRAAAK